MNKKELQFAAECKATGADDSGEFEGYGSVFGVVDSYNEVVDKGAFLESLKDNGMPALLWQHNTYSPIGIYTVAREDERGLFVQGKLNLDVQQGKEAYALLKQGALKGMSIGFNTLVEETDNESGVTHLKKVKLWEVSLVTFPANAAATVSSVKSQPETVRDFEKFLRDAGNFSLKEAKIIASHGFDALKNYRDGGDEALALTALQSAIDQFNKVIPLGTSNQGAHGNR